LVALAGVLALPALVRIGRPRSARGAEAQAPTREHRLLDALRTAIGAALVLEAVAAHGALLVGGLAALGLVIGLPALRRLLPVGTLAAQRGLPATILSRGLLTFVFFGADAFVTLAVTTVLHHGT